MNFKQASISFFSLTVLFTSCVDQKKFENIGIHGDTRWEFAPNMYYSEAYEPLSQVIDDSASNSEAYNSNPYNAHRMNMREPAAHTIKRNGQGYMPYHISKDSLAYAAQTLKSPLDTSAAVLKDGEVLYINYCAHCHGAEGKGDGPVNAPFKGVANLAEGQLKTISEGHIFHVITHGKGRMWPHASQVNQEERWKIAKYIKNNLQK